MFLLKILFGWRLGLVFEDTGRAVFSVEAEELCGVIVAIVRRVFHALFFYVPLVIARLPRNVLPHGGEEVVYTPGDDCVVVPRNVSGDDNDGETNSWEIG